MPVKIRYNYKLGQKLKKIFDEYFGKGEWNFNDLNRWENQDGKGKWFYTYYDGAPEGDITIFTSKYAYYTYWDPNEVPRHNNQVLEILTDRLCRIRLSEKLEQLSLFER